MEPACAVLEISPSTYYAAKKREESPSARDERDEELKKAITQARERRGRKLYGAKKMWRELNRDGIEVAQCTVERLMREMGLEGVRARKKRPRTTVPGPSGDERPSDLLERDFTAPAPNRRWVADITYIETSVGFVYAAFILDLLIDTAWPHRGPVISAAAESLFGAGTRPAAILLTHIHPDHADSALELARLWDLPVHVHPGELPLASGRYLPEYGNPLDRWLISPLLRLMPRRAVEASLSRNSLAGRARPGRSTRWLAYPACRTGKRCPRPAIHPATSPSSAAKTGS